MSHTNTAAEVIKATPAVTYSGAALAGVPIADWVTALTLLYVLAQLILLIPKYSEWYRSWRKSCQSKRDSSKSD